MKNELLGAFEELVMLAIWALPENGYGASVCRVLETATGKPASSGAVGMTLQRLEQKGLLHSWIGEPTGYRGGKRRKFYDLTTSGREAIRLTEATREKIRECLR